MDFNEARSIDLLMLIPAYGVVTPVEVHILASSSPIWSPCQPDGDGNAKLLSGRIQLRYLLVVVGCQLDHGWAEIR